MEQQLQSKDEECQTLKDQAGTHQAEMEKLKKEREFEVTKLKKDVKVIQEKLDEKAKELDEKPPKKEDKYHGKNGMTRLADELREDLKKHKEQKEKV